MSQFWTIRPLSSTLSSLRSLTSAWFLLLTVHILSIPLYSFSLIYIFCKDLFFRVSLCYFIILTWFAIMKWNITYYDLLLQFHISLLLDILNLPSLQMRWLVSKWIRWLSWFRTARIELKLGSKLFLYVSGVPTVSQESLDPGGG